MLIPISALQRNAAAVVRRVVASGVAAEITDRGRVVAILSPPPQASGLEWLRRLGMTRPAEPGALAKVLARTGALPALGLVQALAEQRDSER